MAYSRVLKGFDKIWKNLPVNPLTFIASFIVLNSPAIVGTNRIITVNISTKFCGNNNLWNIEINFPDGILKVKNPAMIGTMNLYNIPKSIGEIITTPLGIIFNNQNVAKLYIIK